MKKYEITTHMVELDITYQCNLACRECNRVCGQAKSIDMITIDQLDRFLGESIKYHQWERIIVAGGEPTIHPNFVELMDILKKFVDQVGCSTLLLTNGCGPEVHAGLAKKPKWLPYSSSKKDPITAGEKFQKFTAAPIDILPIAQAGNYSYGCSNATNCGLGFGCYGIYVCPCAGAIDRVFGFDIGFKSLREVSEESMRWQMDKLCRFCGHFLRNYPSWQNYPMDLVSWPNALDSYQKSTPVLSRY